MAFVRILGIALVVLTIIYVCLMFYFRAGERARLESAWYDGEMETDREDFIRAGMLDYENSFRSKLVWGVYVIPIVAIAAIAYAVNIA